MRKFDTKVQHLKYKVLREVARQAWNDTLLQNVLEIPKTIVPGKTSTMRCCVYKERAILGERVRIAMGGDKDNPNVIEVIDIACDECPAAGYEVTDSCRGCLAHRCEDVCKRGAISFDHNHVAHIDKSKCVECGQCAKVCPYFAIVNRKRPCQIACKVSLFCSCLLFAFSCLRVKGRHFFRKYNMRKTKIVCTISPASESEQIITGLC